jgi:hypothetical protein
MIKTQKDRLFLSTALLGSERAWLWVGFGFGPKDNDDERVLATRRLMERYYPYVPYGMGVGNKKEDGTMAAIADSNGDGYYEVDLSWWPEGASGGRISHEPSYGKRRRIALRLRTSPGKPGPGLFLGHASP